MLFKVQQMISTEIAETKTQQQQRVLCMQVITSSSWADGQV